MQGQIDQRKNPESATLLWSLIYEKVCLILQWGKGSSCQWMVLSIYLEKSKFWEDYRTNCERKVMKLPEGKIGKVFDPGAYKDFLNMPLNSLTTKDWLIDSTTHKIETSAHQKI